MDDEKRIFATAVNMQNCAFLFLDIFNITVIAVLYGVGKDEECGLPINSLFISYIVIKAVCAIVRCCLFGVTIGAPSIGMILNLVAVIIWIIVITAYYILAIVYFFDGDNDCLDEATVHWVALLIIVIEAISMLFLFVVFLSMLALATPFIIMMIQEIEESKERNAY